MSIQVSQISKRFGGFIALDNVSLDFPTGQLVALLGPSGCGKTTLLRIIAGLEHADSGKVLLEGEDASGTNVRERQVGFVFQHYALFRHMSVFDNVAFGMRMKPGRQRQSETQIREKVRKLLELVQLEWLADRFPSQLSGGQRQRIALARALAVEPRVLLLDEPFGALDAKVRKELRRWLRKLHDELHITSIFVTHDQEEALEVADQVVLMNGGHIEQIGAPEEVWHHPATPFVYGFLGSVNLFHGRAAGAGVQVGNEILPHSPGDVTDGVQVLAFARPHELDIVVGETDVENGSGSGVPARVARIAAYGITTRIELDSVDDATPGQHFEVELTRARAAELGLAEGQTVRLVPSNLRVFVDEGAGI
jgi:sulfate transport system ATP-binding protein